MTHDKDSKSPPVLYNKYIFNSNIKSFIEEGAVKKLYPPDNLKDIYPEEAQKLLGKFIKGPIPLPGLVALSKGRLHKIQYTALILFYLRSFSGDQEFKFSYSYTKLLGLQRKTVRRHLKRLAKLGLIELKVQHSKAPLIKIDLKTWGYEYESKL